MGFPGLSRENLTHPHSDLDGGHNFLSHRPNAGLVWPNRACASRLAWMCIPVSKCFLNFVQKNGGIWYTTGVTVQMQSGEHLLTFWITFWGKVWYLIGIYRYLSCWNVGWTWEHTSWSMGDAELRSSKLLQCQNQAFQIMINVSYTYSNVTKKRKK